MDREELIKRAKECGFDVAAPLDPKTLEAKQSVRDMCSADKCTIYGKNWTCPPNCGSLDECADKMSKYKNGIILQTIGKLSKSVDTKAYRETGERHGKNFLSFCDVILSEYPDALCLGAGGCTVCKKCAYPESCRFPEKAHSSMEAYGLFVTQVCRDNGIEYYYGDKTIAYTACVLF